MVMVSCNRSHLVSIEIPHRDLEKHLETCVQSHLMLTMIRVSEQQKVIVDLNKKVNGSSRLLLVYLQYNLSLV